MAIKVFDQGMSAEQAETLARTLTRLCDAPLDHPSIVAPNGAGLNGATAWLAEPYVDGTPLETVLSRRGTLPFAEALLRVTQVAGALDFAAATGVFHGSLHPRDILFAGDRTLVTGLGVAQALAVANVDVPSAGPTSPQRAAGQPATQADDIFALAAITFEALYGRQVADPFHIAQLVGPLKGVDHIRLRGVLQRALAEGPAERPRTALEFAGALQECVVSSAPAPQPAPSFDLHADRAASAAIPLPTVEHDLPPPAPVDDFPLRRTVVEPVAAPHFERAFEPEPRRDRPELHQNLVAGNSILNPDRGTERRSIWLPMAAMLIVGLLAGFVAGFVFGQGEFIPAPFSAERAVPRAARNATQEPLPTSTAGQDFTESAIEGRPSDIGRREVDSGRTGSAGPGRQSELETSASQIGSRSVEATRREAENVARPEIGAEPSGPASIEVVSRPSGAQVYVDERLVGRTPLVLPEVDPGDHSVRIALPGHQRWATRVNVAAGSRARVAASLER